MKLKKLELINFKNLNLILDFDDNINIIIGPNGRGKTNLLEAIYYLSRLESFRVDDVKDIFPWNQEDTGNYFFQIGAKVSNNKNSTKKEHLLHVDINQNDGTIKRSFLIDDVKKSRLKILHFLPIFLFLPKDLDLISGSPRIRRNELDAFIEMIEPEFASIKGKYNRILVSRNRILKQIAEGYSSSQQLEFWDEKLIEYGSQIIKKRLEIIEDFKVYIAETSKKLFSNEFTSLEIKYVSKLVNEFWDSSKSELIVENIKNNFSHKLLTGRVKEMAACRTLYGPQRDDYEIFLGKMNLQKAGSRGQQRLVTLLIKFAMFKFFETKTDKKACLLLDDVMSELDDVNKLKLESIVGNLNTQVIFTSTTEADFSPQMLKSSKQIRI